MFECKIHITLSDIYQLHLHPNISNQTIFLTFWIVQYSRGASDGQPFRELEFFSLIISLSFTHAHTHTPNIQEVLASQDGQPVRELENVIRDQQLQLQRLQGTIEAMHLEDIVERYHPMSLSNDKYVYVYMYESRYVYGYHYVYIREYSCVCIHTYTHIPVFVCVYINIYKYICIYIYIHIYIHIYIYIYEYLT